MSINGDILIHVLAADERIIEHVGHTQQIDEITRHISHDICEEILNHRQHATDRPFTSTDKKVTFRGTYAPIEWDTENTNILFLGTNNTLYYPQPKDGKNPSINACRAYFELNGITVGDPSFSVRSIVFNFDDSETTSIDHSQFTIDNSPLTIDNEAGAWYTLDGRKVNSPFTIHNAQLPKGIYIHGGRKVVIK